MQAIHDEQNSTTVNKDRVALVFPVAPGSDMAYHHAVAHPDGI